MKILIIFIMCILCMQSIPALTLGNINISNSATNSTIFINGSMTLDNVTIVNNSNNFSGLSSSATIRNVNNTYNASVLFNNINPIKDVMNASNRIILFYNANNFSINITPSQQIYIDNILGGGPISAPTILGANDVNSMNYFDRIIKSSYGNIPRLPDCNNGNTQSTRMITSTQNNLTITFNVPLCNQFNSYDNSCNSSTFDMSNLSVCYGTIYGGCTNINFSYILS